MYEDYEYPYNSKYQIETVEYIPPQTGLETPVNPEKPAAKKKRLKRIIKVIIEYEIFGEGSHISTNQRRESTVFSLLIG